MEGRMQLLKELKLKQVVTWNCKQSKYIHIKHKNGIHIKHKNSKYIAMSIKQKNCVVM